MFLNRYKPVYSPDVETGTEEVEGAPPPVTQDEKASGPGSGRSNLRQQLEKGFDDARKATPAPKDAKAPAKAKGTRIGERVAAAADEEPEDPEIAVEAEEAETEAETTPDSEDQVTSTPAPASLSKEARAEWAKTPKVVQDAIIKREADVSKGVEQLKANYAELDRVLAPRLETLKRTGHKPAEAVNQLFAWFEALSANPDVAFPALASSFKYDWQAKLGKQPDPKANGKEAPEPQDIPPAVQQYVSGLEQKLAKLEGAMTEQLGSLQSNFATQSQNRTNEMLGQWSKDKPHFEAVREKMARLIGAGVGLKEDGSVDLDTVYDEAVYANRETRELVLQEQQAKAEAVRKAKVEKEKQAQQAQADKARRTAVGLGTGAPGAPASPNAKTNKVRKSVRESILDAKEELTQ